MMRSDQQSTVLVLPWSPDLPGGVSVVVRNLAREIGERGGNPVVVVSDWAAPQPERGDDGVPRFRFLLVGSTSLFRLIWAAVGAPRRLLALAKFLNELNAVSVNFHYPGLDPLSVAILKTLRATRCRLILSFHGSDARRHWTTVERLLWGFVLRRTDALTACSAALAADVEEAFGLQRGSVNVIYSGVDRSLFHSGPRHREQLVSSGRFIVTVGTYHPLKGHVCLLRAFATLAHKYPDLRLVVAGRDGPERNLLNSVAAQLGISSRVTFLVDLSHSQVAELLSRALACVQPSRSEAFGLVLLEAAACGIPVIASATGGHLDMIRDGENGLLFPVDDAAACAEAMQHVLDDEAAAHHLSETFRRDVEGQFTWEKCAERYTALMEGRQLS